MAKYFIGSVGTAEAFRVVDGELKLAFISKTLTDSGLNISTTKDDIRAGTNAPIVASFYHDPSVEVTLTDVMFKTAYVEAQLGADFEAHAEAYQTDELESNAQKRVSLKKLPVSIGMGCGSKYIAVWYTEAGKDEWKLQTLESATQDVIMPKADTKYCVRYLAQDDAARVAVITSSMIPQELFLIITAPLFAGDACSASNGKQAGTIQFEIPRFKLNGAQDFAMAMSSNQTLSLSGIALAAEGGCDINKAELLKIREVVWGRTWVEGAEELMFDADYLGNGDTVKVYAIYENGSTAIVDNSELTFTLTGQGNSITAAGVLTVAVAGTIKAEHAASGLKSEVEDLEYSA